MKNIVWSTGHPLKLDNIVNSDNCFLFDSKGNKLIDLESGVWCTSVGHNNKRVNDVITSQINKITHTGFCYCNPQIEITAQKVLEITEMGVLVNVQNLRRFLLTKSEFFFLNLEVLPVW
jgi:acetylornithine aminotransferase